MVIFSVRLLKVLVWSFLLTVTALQAAEVRLSDEESDWLNAHPTIRVGVMNNWAPISFVDAQNQINGISVDYFHVINASLGERLVLVPGSWAELILQLKNKQIDALLDLTNLPERQNAFLFTSPYLIIPHVLITKRNSTDLLSFADLSGKVLALEKGFGSVHHVREQFPDVLVHEYSSTAKALEAVANGTADAYVGNRAVTIYTINETLITNLRINTLLDNRTSALSMGIRYDWPILQSILQKALDAMSLADKQAIQARWVDLNIDEAYQWQQFWRYAIGVLVLIGLLLVWMLYLRFKIKWIKEAFHQQLHYDLQTGLPKEMVFKERLQHLLDQTQAPEASVLVLAFSVEGLEKVKKAQGVDFVDALLVQVALRLRQAAGEKGLLARYSNHHFLMALPDFKSRKAMESFTQQLQEELALNYVVDGKPIHLLIRIGGSVYPEDAQDVNLLIENALLTFDESPAYVKKRLVFYSDDMNESFKSRALLDQAMDASFQRGEFEVYFQPKVNIKTGQINSFEALLRWMHPSLGSVSPDVFIPIAEDNEHILAIGRFVFASAITEAKKWQVYAKTPISVAVNLSPIQLKDAGIVEFIAQQLTQQDLAPELLEIEITEGVLMSEKVLGLHKLNELKALGVRLSMDDFGKGYSSLSYLRRFPFDVLKIDKEFIDNLEDNESNQNLVVSILALANSMGLTVVAEGVETFAQVQFLKDKGCHLAQGYYFSQAIPAEQVQAFYQRFKVS